MHVCINTCMYMFTNTYTHRCIEHTTLQHTHIHTLTLSLTHTHTNCSRLFSLLSKKSQMIWEHNFPLLVCHLESAQNTEVCVEVAVFRFTSLTLANDKLRM
eukprot:TRINITY_DN20439_c0_g1_i4.p1 TRINITY_DN20439_c0_g1~~TRINITY_DN20439_c0_g1_i4.p1  ORF type:complete len:101 (+),score=9.33 TRINITY_DN20439_c0_g1_i4:47-349(+)